MPLRVVAATVPKVHVHNVDTGGYYPQVRFAGLDVRRANQGLHDAILADENAIEPWLRVWRHRIDEAEPPTVYADQHGFYGLDVDPDLMSASSVVVSALLPRVAEVSYPSEAHGYGWLGLIVDAQTGETIPVSTLIRDRMSFNKVVDRVICAEARRRLHIACFDALFDRHTLALLPGALAIGTPQIGPLPPIRCDVPYDVVGQYLTPRGVRLVNGVRPATGSTKLPRARWNRR